MTDHVWHCLVAAMLGGFVVLALAQAVTSRPRK